MSFSGSLSRSGGGLSFAFVTGFVAKTQVPPLLLGLRASLYRPNQSETISMRDCYILCGRSGVPDPLGRRIVSDASRSCCRRFLHEGGIIVLGLLLGPDAIVTGVLALGHGTVCFVSLELDALVLSLHLFFVKNLLSSWWTGVDVALVLILARLLLRGYCPLVPRSLPPVLCGGGAGPGLARACSPGHITACSLEAGPWALLPRSCAYHPPPSHRLAQLGVRVRLHILKCCVYYFLEILDSISSESLVPS